MLTNSNFYIGDSSISRLYQGDNLVWDASHPDILCQYISNGDASTQPNVYFNSSVSPSLTTKVEIRYSIHSKMDSTVLFGSGKADNSTTRYWLYLHAGINIDGTIYQTNKFWYRNTEWGYPGSIRIDEPHVISTFGNASSTSSATQVSIAVDGSIYDKTISLSAGIANPQPMYIFARNNHTEADMFCPADTKIYYMKIWEANNLIRFYIPVLHWNNGQYVPCLYDKVNDTYSYNLGTDTPTYKIQGDYLLDYLGSSPENAIPDNKQVVLRYDTGVVASNQLQTDAKGRLVWGRENYLFGSGTSNQTTPTWQPYGYQTAGGSTDADKMRLRMGFGATSVGNNGIYVSTDASTVVAVNTISTYFDASRGWIYLNDTKLNGSSPVPDLFSSQTIHLFSRHGDATNINALGGSRIYYINFTNSNIPAKTYIPVLHNNQAAFLDLNSGTYIYNLGTAAPYYQFKN